MGGLLPRAPWVTVTLLAVAKLAAAVDLATCKANIQARLDNKTILRNNSIFYFNGTTYMSERDSIALTIQGCESNCPKPFFDLYNDMWPRLLTWLIPALLLIGSIHLPRVGHLNRLFVIIHFIGDPIDSMWSLLTKGEVWNRFYALALQVTPQGPDQLPTAKALAAMLSAFEELTGDMETVQQDFTALMTDNEAQLSRKDLDYLLKESAEELVDSRSSEGLRTALVIVNYLWAVLAALVPEIGGTQSSQPGERIGTAMFLSWLVTAVLLSNTVSGFTSRRTCLRITERYVRTIKGRRRDLHFFHYSPRLLAAAQTHSKASSSSGTPETPKQWEDFISAQPWNGSVYSYRPRKRLPPTSPSPSLRTATGDRSPVYLFSLSLAPPGLAAISAFAIIWFTPTIGLGCRTLWVLALGSGMLVSPALTALASRFLRPNRAWHLTLAKDAVFGLAGVSVIVLSSIGIFNTCWCWSGVYSRGVARAYIDLDPQRERDYNLHHLYPALVAACLVLQIGVYGLMHRVMKPGGVVFRPGEDEKMQVYRAVHGLAERGGTGAGEVEMTGKGNSVSIASEAAPLLLPAAAIGSPRESSLLGPRAGEYASSLRVSGDSYA